MSVLYGFCKNGELKLACNIDERFTSYSRKDIILFIRENTIEELNEKNSVPTEEQLKVFLVKRNFVDITIEIYKKW